MAKQWEGVTGANPPTTEKPRAPSSSKSLKIFLSIITTGQHLNQWWSGLYFRRVVILAVCWSATRRGISSEKLPVKEKPLLSTRVIGGCCRGDVCVTAGGHDKTRTSPNKRELWRRGRCTGLQHDLSRRLKKTANEWEKYSRKSHYSTRCQRRLIYQCSFKLEQIILAVESRFGAIFQSFDSLIQNNCVSFRII